MNILITGANQRIGLYLTERYLQQKETVIALVRTPSKELLNLQQQYGQFLMIHPIDLLQLTWDITLWEALPSVHHIVHCASVFHHDDIHSSTASYRDECLAIHYDTFVNSTIGWFQQGGKGSIVHFLDQKIQRLNPDHLSYTLSKMAAYSAVPILAQATAPHIRVNAVAPGLTLPSGEQDVEQFNLATAALPLKMGATLDSLFDAVHFLITHQNITGQTLTIDGGQHLMSERDILFQT